MDEQQHPRARRESLFSAAKNLIAAVKAQARVAAAFVGGIATAVALVWNTASDYQSVKSQVETNRRDIEVLRVELHLLQSSAMHVTPERTTP